LFSLRDKPWSVGLKFLVRECLDPYTTPTMPIDSNDPLSQIPVSIDQGMSTSADFDWPGIPTAKANFRPWHVEPLLDQAADLLDRGIRDRATYDDLRARFADLVLRVTQFERIDVIHTEEVTNHSLEQDYNMSMAQQRSYDALRNGYDQANAYIQHLFPNFNGQGPVITGEFTSQELVNTGQKDSATALRDAAADQAWFENKNIGFKNRRDTVARDMNALLDSLMTKSGLAYNYVEQSDHLRTRFTRDFRDAYVRMLVARDGLNTIYGVDIPGFPEITPATPADAPIFDSAVTWVRDAIRYLVGFGQLDQSYVLTVSVRKVMQEASWNAAIAAAGAAAPIQFTFLFDEATFSANQRHVRLRGVGACVLSTATGPWKLTIKPPDDSFFHYLRRDRAGNLTGTVNQRDVPPVRLGRVLPRLPQRDPDVSGAVSLRNVSPLSATTGSPGTLWSVTIDRKSAAGDDASAIDDIQLDLQLVMRSV
jgi:hypothetical protein